MSRPIQVRLTEAKIAAINQAIQNEHNKNRSDFIEESITAELRKRGLWPPHSENPQNSTKKVEA